MPFRQTPEGVEEMADAGSATNQTEARQRKSKRRWYYVRIFLLQPRTMATMCNGIHVATGLAAMSATSAMLRRWSQRQPCCDQAHGDVCNIGDVAAMTATTAMWQASSWCFACRAATSLVLRLSDCNITSVAMRGDRTAVWERIGRLASLLISSKNQSADA